MRYVLIPRLVAVLALSAVLIGCSKPAPSGSNQPAPAGSGPAKTEPDKTQPSTSEPGLTAEQLTKEFAADADGKAFDAKYKDKVITIVGVVTSPDAVADGLHWTILGGSRK